MRYSAGRKLGSVGGLVVTVVACLVGVLAPASPAGARGWRSSVDPRVAFSTYLGGGDFDSFPYTTLDRFGNVYLAGQTCSSNFPTTVGAFQRTLSGACDVYVAKLSPDGARLIYSTLLGGGDVESPGGIDIDASGNAYVTGQTSSSDFPSTSGAFQTSAGGRADAFAAKLNPTGSALVYSTYLGGASDDSAGVSAVDPAGRLFIAGWTGSADFPITKGALQRTFAGGDGLHCGTPCDSFVAELNRSGTGLLSSTYLGGSGDEVCCSGAVDRFGRFHLTGTTDSTDFPTTAGAFDRSYNGGDIDTWVATVGAGGSALISSTFLGGSCGDFPNDLVLDAAGSTYVSGATCATDFPTTAGVFQPTNAGDFDGFVARFNPAQSALVYSTYLGGTGTEFAEGLAVDQAGNAYVDGVTTSTDLPITPDAIQSSFAGGGDGSLCFGLPCDGWLMKLSPDASMLRFSTYLGGSGDDWAAGGVQVDTSGTVIVQGFTSSVDFLTTAGAFQTAQAGFVDAFITKVRLGQELAERPVSRGPRTPVEDRRWPGDPTVPGPRSW